MSGWTIEGDAWLNADGAYAVTYAEILNAMLERSGGGVYTPDGIKGVDVFYGYTTGIGIRSLQDWLSQLCGGTNFIKSHNPDGSKKSPSEFIGTPMAGRDTNPFTYWTFEEVMNVASGNIGKNHFRRATEFPQDWTDYNDPAYLYGYAQPGDLVGPWLYVDMQKALNLLHWKYRYFDPYWYYAKYSGGCTFRHKDGGAQGSYTTLDAIKAQAIADWNSQAWSTGESTYASKVNAIAQSWVVQVDPPTSHCDASLEMEKVTYRFAIGSAAQSIMSMFISAWRHGSGTTDESEFDSFGLGYLEGAANLIQTFDFSQSVSTDQAETKLLGDCPDPPGWPTHLYRADEGQNFLQGERGYILDNYAHCILDYVAGGKYVYY